MIDEKNGKSYEKYPLVCVCNGKKIKIRACLETILQIWKYVWQVFDKTLFLENSF